MPFKPWKRGKSLESRQFCPGRSKPPEVNWVTAPLNRNCLEGLMELWDYFFPKCWSTSDVSWAWGRREAQVLCVSWNLSCSLATDQLWVLGCNSNSRGRNCPLGDPKCFTTPKGSCLLRYSSWRMKIRFSSAVFGFRSIFS